MTGEIINNYVLDYEDRRDGISFQVRAKAPAEVEGGPERVSDARVVVRLIDVNDNPPTFVLPTYTFLKINNLPIDSAVSQVQARDPDVGNNSVIQYMLTSNPGDYFRIDTYTGLIRVNKTLPGGNVS